MNNSATKFCPVPLEQQPTYEYQQLKNSWFFGWATLPVVDYIKKILWVGFATSPIVAPIAAVSFLPVLFPLKFVITTLIGIVFLTSLVLLQLYFGWSHVKSRLQQPRISYEESGWYDGQSWKKPSSMLDRDRLVVSYEIQPIMNRLRKTFSVFLGITVVGIIIWFV